MGEGYCTCRFTAVKSGWKGKLLPHIGPVNTFTLYIVSQPQLQMAALNCFAFNHQRTRSFFFGGIQVVNNLWITGAVQQCPLVAVRAWGSGTDARGWT